MIVGDLKPFDELAGSLAGFERVLVLGCGGCVTVCRAGGDAEAHDVARELAHPRWFPRSEPPLFEVRTIERQCEHDLLRAFLPLPDGTQAILSLACGAGVQIVADVFEPLPVLPALSTTFLGGADEPGIWREKCKGCGDCLLATTGGVCPIALCAKSLLNGPCGGSHDGHCELGPDIPCAWVRVYRRLEAQGRLELLDEVRGTRDWRKAGYRGPRRRARTGIALR
ncbi:MAG: methylenetetrahydrofolate reductase C-terminal domain-containing protein [Deltaproteobacteria bacterium]|nr:methylenetetrahydrofolate reductase C-terminal domain-containing protein [Deltaproteobacteria bacterium]